MNPFDTYSFAAQLDNCHDPEAALNALLTKAPVFSNFRKGMEKGSGW